MAQEAGAKRPRLAAEVAAPPATDPATDPEVAPPPAAAALPQTSTVSGTVTKRRILGKRLAFATIQTATGSCVEVVFKAEVFHQVHSPSCPPAQLVRARSPPEHCATCSTPRLRSQGRGRSCTSATR